MRWFDNLILYFDCNSLWCTLMEYCQTSFQVKVHTTTCCVEWNKWVATLSLSHTMNWQCFRNFVFLLVFHCWSNQFRILLFSSTMSTDSSSSSSSSSPLLFFYSSTCGFTKRVEPEVECAEKQTGKVTIKQRKQNNTINQTKNNAIHQQSPYEQRNRTVPYSQKHNANHDWLFSFLQSIQRLEVNSNNQNNADYWKYAEGRCSGGKHN